MGWICLQCGSENGSRQARCPACLHKAGWLQRRRRPRRGDAATNALLDRWSSRAAALPVLAKVSRRALLAMLLLTALLLTGTRLLIMDESGCPALADVWQIRWPDMGAVFSAGERQHAALTARQHVDRLAAPLQTVGQNAIPRAQDMAALVRVVRDFAAEQAVSTMTYLLRCLGARLAAAQDSLSRLWQMLPVR